MPSTAASVVRIWHAIQRPIANDRHWQPISSPASASAESATTSVAFDDLVNGLSPRTHQGVWRKGSTKPSSRFRQADRVEEHEHNVREEFSHCQTAHEANRHGMTDLTAALKW